MQKKNLEFSFKNTKKNFFKNATNEFPLKVQSINRSLDSDLEQTISYKKQIFIFKAQQLSRRDHARSAFKEILQLIKNISDTYLTRARNSIFFLSLISQIYLHNWRKHAGMLHMYTYCTMSFQIKNTFQIVKS